MTSECRRRPATLRVRLWLLSYAVICTVALAPAVLHARQPAPATGGPAASADRTAQDHPAEGEHSQGTILQLVARIVNFAALAALLGYFLKAPLLTYLQSRGSEIRQDLVSAAEMRRAATAQLEEIARKLQALPAELEALKARGAEDVRAEQARLAEALTAERERLLDQTRRDIAMRLRLARRELIEHAADLAMRIAEARIRRSLTPEDHLRLIDRYTTQVQEAR